MGRRIAAIIRHGDYQQRENTPSALQPYPLNAAGKKHAEQAALTIGEWVDENGWQLVPEIDCSEQLRAWQTAEIIATTLNGSLTSFQTLSERSVGAAANLTSREIREVIHNDPRYPDLPQGWKSDSHFRLPLQGAESLLEAGERVARHLQTRIDQLPNADDSIKLFVGHGAAFRHAAYHLGLLEYEQIAKLSMYHGTPLLFERLDDESWSHLDGAWKIRITGADYRD
ncbi:MAG: histidine phosphatase family protein [Gammaproteobacteria bacterium]|nr:histidine phosphatase family protein [Gammaproteobacteria bacterium]MBT7308759.1 histidine phosphatase family protein [Gammaproteobacteria bacterium]